jgi:hypothetical protein
VVWILPSATLLDLGLYSYVIRASRGLLTTNPDLLADKASRKQNTAGRKRNGTKEELNCEEQRTALPEETCLCVPLTRSREQRFQRRRASVFL